MVVLCDCKMENEIKTKLTSVHKKKKGRYSARIYYCSGIFVEMALARATTTFFSIKMLSKKAQKMLIILLTLNYVRGVPDLFGKPSEMLIRIIIHN